MEATVYRTCMSYHRIYAKDAAGKCWTVTGWGIHEHHKGAVIQIQPCTDFINYATLIR